jgi:hypothetical protein
MRLKFYSNKTEDEYPDLTDGQIYDAEDEPIEILGETRYMVYDDSGDVDPTPYDAKVFEVETSLAMADTSGYRSGANPQSLNEFNRIR